MRVREFTELTAGLPASKKQWLWKKKKSKSEVWRYVDLYWTITIFDSLINYGKKDYYKKKEYHMYNLNCNKCGRPLGDCYDCRCDYI